MVADYTATQRENNCSFEYNKLYGCSLLYITHVVYLFLQVKNKNFPDEIYQFPEWLKTALKFRPGAFSMQHANFIH